MCLFEYNWIKWVSNMYQSFFLIFKAVEFRPVSGEILYAFIFYISLKQIIALAFHSELPLGTVCFIGGKKNLDVFRDKARGWKQGLTVQQAKSRLHGHCEATTAPGIKKAHSGALSQARLLQRNISKGGLGSLPIAFRKPAASLCDLNKTEAI